MANNILAPATSVLPQVLIQQFVQSSETTQYLTPAATTVRITNASLCNTSASTVTVSVSVVKTGGTAGNSSRILSAFPLAAGDSTTLPELVGHVLGPGDFISALAGTASTVAFVVSGVITS